MEDPDNSIFEGKFDIKFLGIIIISLFILWSISVTWLLILCTLVVILLFLAVRFVSLLSKAINIKNILHSRLVGSVYTAEESCGIIDSINIHYMNARPVVHLKVLSYPLNEFTPKCVNGFYFLTEFGMFDLEAIHRWPLLAASHFGLNLHSELSPESKSFLLLEKYLIALKNGILKLSLLDKKISGLSRSLSICASNPLLEPSLDNLEKSLAQARYARPKLKTYLTDLELKTNALRDFLSLPDIVRESLTTTSESEIAYNEEGFEQDFEELVDFMQTLDDLVDGRI